MAVNLKEAERFIEALTGSASAAVWFQTFSDQKDASPDPLQRKLWGTLAEHGAELARLNQAGAGIFVQINDGAGREKAEITRARAVWQDDDACHGWSGEIPPSVVVETSPGKRQRLILTDTGDLNAHDAVQRRLVADHGCDAGAQGRNRVLRLPGFLHQKNPAEPFLVRLEHCETERVPWARILAVFPPLDKADASTPKVLDRPETMSDGAVIAAARARFGAGFSRLFDEGDTGGDHSQADFALLAMLARFSRNSEQLTRIFEESALIREKWRDRADYRDRSITRALEATYNEAEGVFGFTGTAAPRTCLYDAEPVSGDTLCAAPPPPREFIFSGPGGLPRGVVGIIAATGGVGKTMLALQIAASVASGRDCLGGAFQFEASGPVVAVLAEDDRDEIARRLWRTEQECGPLDLSQLHILPRGGDARLVTRDHGGNLQPTPGFGKLLGLVERVRPVLVFVDSLSVTAGEAEAGNPDGAYVLDLLARLCEPSGAAVVVLAHVSKASQSSKASAGKKDSPERALYQALDPMAVRGSSSIVNNARWCMTATPVPRGLNEKLGAAEDAQAIAYAVRKTNYSAPLEIAYLHNDGGFLRPLEVAQAPDPTQAVLDLLREEGPLSRRDLADSATYRARLGFGRDTIREAITRLVDWGALTEVRDGRHVTLKVVE